MKNEIYEIGKNVIELEIRALKKLKNSLDKSFNDTVQAISKCKSKVVICGVGKSGIIASKISATLSSVGAPSFSIPVNDCSHGDLGRITNQDILIPSGAYLEIYNKPLDTIPTSSIPVTKVGGQLYKQFRFQYMKFN